MTIAPSRPFFWLPLAAVAAACAPSLLAYNVAPSATVLNQALAVFCWGWVAAACAWEIRLSPDERRASTAALMLPGACLMLLLLAALGGHLVGHLPRSLALLAVSLLAAAFVLLVAGARAGAAAEPQARLALTWFAIGWLVAGLLGSAIACVQVLAPHWADGRVIARSGLEGRGIGNLRQPNHLSTLLLWATISTIALQDWATLRRAASTLLLLFLAAGLVLTASRTALLGVVLMAFWGLADRRLAQATRVSLVAMPVFYGLCWGLLAWWARANAVVLGAEQRLAEPDLSSTRFDIWANALELIRQHPWTGVGFGEFNFAWTLSPLPQRPVAFFDHAHNLFLHWAVELGLPAAGLLTVMLAACGLRMLLAVVRTPRAAASSAGKAALPLLPTLALRITMALLALMLLHSQLEYPLWYAYFLLPSAWLLGFGMAQAAALRTQAAARQSILVSTKARRKPWRPRHAAPLLGAGGLMCAAGAILAVVDYRQVAAIYASESAPSLQERLDQGLRSPLFAHQAAYAAATTSTAPEREMDNLRQAAHSLLDTRLMIAWAKAYAASGDLPRAQYVVARLREFRNPAAGEFFETCTQDAGAQAPSPQITGRALTPFQCQPADTRVILQWTHFR